MKPLSQIESEFETSQQASLRRRIDVTKDALKWRRTVNLIQGAFTALVIIAIAALIIVGAALTIVIVLR